MNQPLAYVHPGAKIARNVVIEPFTTIHNNVVIGDGTWIGIGVSILPNVRIGKNCIIGANAVVTHDVPDYHVAIGVPAKNIGRADRCRD